MRVGVVDQEPYRVREYIKHGVDGFDAALRRSWSVENQAGVECACHTAAQTPEGIHQPHGFSQPRCLAVDYCPGPFGGTVSGTETCASGGDDQAVEALGKAPQSLRHWTLSVFAHRPLHDSPSSRGQPRLKSFSGLVLARAVDHTIRDGQNLRMQRRNIRVVLLVVMMNHATKL